MGTVECPVCFLYLRAGMSLEDHLETHPKDKVIQALVSMAMRKSATPPPSLSENPSIHTSQSSALAVSTSNTFQRPPQPIECSSANSSSSSSSSVPFMPRPILTILNAPHQNHHSIGHHQHQPSSSMQENQTQLFNNQGTSSGNTFMDSNGHHHNVMIVKSYSSKYVHQQHPQAPAPSSSHELVKRNIFAPRYTTLLESAPPYPPPPYSQHIMSVAASQQSSLNSMPAKNTVVYNNNNNHDTSSASNNNSTSTTTSSFLLHDEEISLITTEIPHGQNVSEKNIAEAQKIVQDDDKNEQEMDVGEEESGILIEQPEIIEIENDESANTDEEYMFIEEENIEEEVIEIKKEDPDYIPDEKIRNKCFNFIVDPIPSTSRCKKSTTGLKVLSNVKVTTDLSQGIKDIILNLNNKTAAVNQTPIITPTKLSSKEFIKTVDNQCKNELIINSGNNMPLIDLDNVNDIEIIDDDDENGDEDCYIGSIEVKTSLTGQQTTEEEEAESISPLDEDVDISQADDGTSANAEDLSSNNRDKSVSPIPMISSVITSVIRMTPHPLPTTQNLISEEEGKNVVDQNDANKTYIGKDDDNQQIQAACSSLEESNDEESSKIQKKELSYDNTPSCSSMSNSAIKATSIFNRQPKKLTVKLKTSFPLKQDDSTNISETVTQNVENINKDAPVLLLVPKVEIKCEPLISCTSIITSSLNHQHLNKDDVENSNIGNNTIRDTKMDFELIDNKASIKIEKDLSEVVDYAGHNAKVVESNDIRYGEEVFNVKILEASEGEMLLEGDEEDNKSNNDVVTTGICDGIVGYKYETEDYHEAEITYVKNSSSATSTSTSSMRLGGGIDENYSKFDIRNKDIFEAGPSRSSKYIDYSDEYNNYMQPEQIPLAWVQKFSPQYTPFDDQVSYTDLDMCSKNNSNSASGSNSSKNENIARANSTESLNIRTDEQMPAKGEISEQESNGEIELSWNRLYPFSENAPIYSYDMSTAQECWNLRRSDTETATSSINFQLLGQNADDKSFVKVKFEVEEEGLVVDQDLDRSKKVKTRTYRCLNCPKTFLSLKQKKAHTVIDHADLESKLNVLAEAAVPPPSAWPSSSSTVSTTTSYDASATATTSSFLPYDGACSSQASRSNILLNKKIKQEPIAVLMSYSSLKQELEMKKENAGETTNEFRIKRTYICGTCKLEFVSFKLFNRHLLIHPAECYTCGRCFKHWPNFTLHIKRHLGIKDHQCNRCDKKFVIRQKLIEHMRIHTGQAPIKCPDCDLYFKRYSNLAQHRNRHHLKKISPKKDYVCQCGEVFQSKAKLEWHKEIHENRPKSCPYCREKFIHKNSLTRHMRLSHTDKYIKIKLESGTEMCTICQKPYIKTNLKRHMETHTSEKLGYSCTICNKRFSTNWNLKQHKWTHANPTSKPFQCNLCSSAFVREADYIMHMNAHKSIRPYTCNYCGCQFIRKYNWVRHTREHETDKNYTCETCGRKFHRKYYLTEHNRIHTGERPFSCNICGKTSSTKTNHNKHIKIHHARDPLTSEN